VQYSETFAISAAHQLVRQTQVRAALIPGQKIPQNTLNKRQIGTRGPSRLFGKEENCFFDVCWTVHYCDNWRIKTDWMSLIILLYMFRALLYPSSGACDYNFD